MYSIEVLVRVLSRMWRNRQTRTFQVRMPQGVWVQVPPSALSADQMVSAFFVRTDIIHKKSLSDLLLQDIIKLLFI